MELTIGDGLVLENVLHKVVAELRENNVKNLSLNISIKITLQKLSKLCSVYRSEIEEIIPDRLRELNAIENRSEDEETERNSIVATTNSAIELLLKKTFNLDVFNLGIDIELIKKIDLTFDASNAVYMLFFDNDSK